MKRLISMFVGVVVPAFMLVGVAANPAMAQGKAKEAKAETGKAVQKVLFEDDRVRVTETTFKPGDTGPNVVRGFRVTRALRGGTAERTWADGKKEKIEWKTGEVRVQGPDKQAFVNKNVGKTDIVLYTVNIKQPK